MKVAILSGVIAAVSVSALHALSAVASGWAFSLGVFAALVLVVGWVCIRFTPPYFGVSDLIGQIHAPGRANPPWVWVTRGFLSGLLFLWGGRAGAEGLASEVVYGFSLSTRPHAWLWFEQRRRTDAAVALAAGFAAAFQAPLAAVVLVLEWSVGGRVMSALVASCVSYLSLHLIQAFFPATVFFPALSYRIALENFTWLGAADLKGIGALLALGLGGGLLLVGGVRVLGAGLRRSFPERSLSALGVGFIFLLILSRYSPESLTAPPVLLHEMLWGAATTPISWVTVLSLGVSLCLVLGTFGTLGMLGPVFTWGAVLSLACLQMFGAALGWDTSPERVIVFGLLGAGFVMSAGVGLPLTVSVLIYELTGSASLFGAALVGGLLVSEVRKRLGVASVVDLLLRLSGIEMQGGRARAVMDRLQVKDAMLTPVVCVDDREKFAVVQEIFRRSRVPYIPVVDSKKRYVGLLTADALHGLEGESIESYFEAKDLLYRPGHKTPILKEEAPLADALGHFDRFPCLPVLNTHHQVVGLLFSDLVRLAYDCENTRRAIS